MAIDQGTETLAIKTEERTWRINIETPKGGIPVVTIFREMVRIAPDGTILSKERSGDYDHSLLDMATEHQPFTPAVSGQVSGLELSQLVAAKADLWRLKDIADALAAKEAAQP